MSISFLFKASSAVDLYNAHFALSKGSFESFMPSLSLLKQPTTPNIVDTMRASITNFRIQFPFLLGVFIVLTVSDTNIAFAASASPDILGDIAVVFYNKSEGWSTTLVQAAYTLFHYLIIIDICLFGIRGALDIKTGAPIGSLVGEFVLFILFAAFMYTCIKYYKEWSNQIIHGFIQLGKTAGGEKVDVSDILRTGLDIFDNIKRAMKPTEPINSLGFFISGLIMLICFALMAAEVLLIKCESFIVMNAGIVLLGFGGMRYFKDYSVNFMKYGFCVAIKLFVLQLMMSIIMSFTEGFKQEFPNNCVFIHITMYNNI
ncbi:MAG: P-type conjugative transfer protein TrbL [Desulfovibrio sp.]|nr:P-type conjugative transfer protein TrbL [Desulfovibrio sp.]